MRSRHFFFVRFTAAAIAAAITLGARGAEPPPLEFFVPAGFDLTVRVNVRQALDSQTLKPIRDRLINENVKPFIQLIQQITGIDLLKDVNAVVVAARFDDPNKEHNVVIVQGRLEEEAVLKFFQMSPKFEKIPLGNKTLYGHWSDDDKAMRYFGFLDKGVIAMGPRKSVENTLLSAGDASKGHMADNPLYKERLAAVSKHNLVRAVVLIPSNAPADNPVGEMLLKSARAVGAGVTLGSGIKIGVDLTALDARSARLWREMTEGGLALVQMLDQFPQFGVMARRVILMSRGSSVSASLAMSLDEAVDLLATNPKLRTILKE